MNFFQKDIETMPRKELEALQLERLKRIVAYCYNNTKFYHDKLDAAGVGDGSKIKVLSDIEGLIKNLVKVFLSSLTLSFKHVQLDAFLIFPLKQSISV